VPVSDSSGATAGPAAAGSPKTAFTGGAAGSAAPSAASAPTVGPVSPTFGASSPVEPAPPQDLRTIVFVAVVLVGLGLLVLRRIARRATAP
jgi:MYXO-CTERM domain-containing protein